MNHQAVPVTKRVEYRFLAYELVMLLAVYFPVMYVLVRMESPSIFWLYLILFPVMCFRIPYLLLFGDSVQVLQLSTFTLLFNQLFYFIVYLLLVIIVFCSFFFCGFFTLPPPSLSEFFACLLPLVLFSVPLLLAWLLIDLVVKWILNKRRRKG